MDKLGELAKRLRPYIIKTVRDYSGDAAGGSEFPTDSAMANSIILITDDGVAADSFTADSTGFDAALAVAASGDVIIVPACSIADNHTVGSGIEVTGMGAENTEFSGTITNNGILTNLYVSGTLTNNATLYGVYDGSDLYFTQDIIPDAITLTNMIDIIRDEDDMASDDENALSTQQAIKAYVDNNAGGGDLVGEVKMVAFETVPSGWLECDGSAVSRSTYSDLYSAIGTNFGEGDGSTTFNVPDMRGMFPRGWDHGAGTDPDSASRTAQNTGGDTGDHVGSEQDDEFESHGHAHKRPTKEISGGSDKKAPGRSDDSTALTGGNETRPKNVYFMFIIKT